MKRSFKRSGLSVVELMIAAHILVFVLTMSTVYVFSLMKSIDTSRQRSARRFYSEYVLSFLRSKVLISDRVFIHTASVSGENYTRSENIFLRTMEQSSGLIPEVRWVCFSFFEGDGVSGELRYYRSSTRSLYDDNNDVGTLTWSEEWVDDSLWSVTIEDDSTNALLVNFPSMFYVRIDFVKQLIDSEETVFIDRRLPNKHLTEVSAIADIPGTTTFITTE